MNAELVVVVIDGIEDVSQSGAGDLARLRWTGIN